MLFIKYYYDDQIKEDNMHEACSKQWKKREVYTKFQLKNFKWSDHVEDLEIVGRLLLKCILKI
jgi:hypothetical protein